MAFKVMVEGEEVFSTDDHITGARLFTAAGEKFAMGVTLQEGVINIGLDRVAPGGPIHLDQLEQMQAQQARDYAADQTRGYSEQNRKPVDFSPTQGEHTETLQTTADNSGLVAAGPEPQGDKPTQNDVPTPHPDFPSPQPVDQTYPPVGASDSSTTSDSSAEDSNANEFKV